MKTLPLMVFLVAAWAALPLACGTPKKASSGADEAAQSDGGSTTKGPPPAPLPLGANDLLHCRVLDGWIGEQRDLTLAEDGNATLHDVQGPALGAPYDGTATFVADAATLGGLRKALAVAVDTGASYRGGSSDCTDVTLTWRAGASEVTALAACDPNLPAALQEAVRGAEALIAQGQPLLPARQ